MDDIKKKSAFARNNKRTSRIISNTVSLFLLKMLSIGLRLMLVPLTLGYLGVANFGLWILLSSMVEMLLFFDLGLGSSLRNKIAESIAKKQIREAKVYVSTSYLIMVLVVLPVVTVLLVLNRQVDWLSLLGLSLEQQANTANLVECLVVFYGAKLIFGLIVPITKGAQRPVFASILEFTSDLLGLSAVIFLIVTASGDGSILLLGITRFAAICFVPLFGSIILFNTVFKEFTPSIFFFRISHAKNLFTIGWKFLLIQMSSLVIFSTDSLIIGKLLGFQEIVSYSVVFQYFNLITIGFAVISIPLWSAYTEAYMQDDFEWILKVIKKMLLIFLLVILLVLLMGIVAKPIIQIWIGRELFIDSMLIFFMGIYVLVQAWNRIFNWALSGINELNCTFITMLIGAAINIPLSIVFVTMFNLGSAGVILATIISLSIFSLASPYILKATLNRKIASSKLEQVGDKLCV